jgi:2'-5' RNA ligase
LVTVARLFFSVDVSPAVAAAVEAHKEMLRRVLADDMVRFTDPSQSHVTLRFLGEVDPERQEAALSAGRRAAMLGAPFEMALESIGYFPDGRRPHTLWIGTGAGGTQLVTLARQLTDELAKEGFAAEERPFVPHLTIARIKGRLSSRTLDALHGAMRPPECRLIVESFALMESRPSGRVHVHTPVEVFAFGR